MPSGWANDIKMKFSVVRSFGWGMETTGKENEFARRLVASYNACEGVPIEILEVLPIDFIEQGQKIVNERLKAQNAQLLEALQEVVEYFGLNHPGVNDIEFVVRINSAISATNPQQEPDYDNQAKEYESDQREASAPTPYDP